MNRIFTNARAAGIAAALLIALTLPALAAEHAQATSGCAPVAVAHAPAAHAQADAVPAAHVHAAHAHAVHSTAAHAHAVEAAHAHSHDCEDGDGEDDGFRWSLYDPKTDQMTGGSDDRSTDGLRRLARREGRELMWFERDGREWVVSDPALLSRAHASMEPMRDLGREMGRVGREQGRMGARAGRYGGELGRVAGRRGALAARLATLSLHEDLDDRELVEARREIRREMRELEREQERVEARMHDLDEPGMRRASERLGEMGRRMGELARTMQRTMRSIADEAIRTGKARPLRGSL